MIEIKPDKPRRAKRRVAVPAIVAGGLSSLLLAFSFTPTFSALTAIITNSTNTAGVGTLIMSETDGTTTCLSSAGTNNNLASCTINKYGGDLKMVPGASKTTNVTITNTGTTAASLFTLTPSACTPTPTTPNLCSKVKVTITATQSGTTTTLINGVYASAMPTTAQTISNNVPAGGVVTFVVTIAIDNVDNSYQGATISQPLTWTFSA
jgi:hypothetical protein